MLIRFYDETIKRRRSWDFFETMKNYEGETHEMVTGFLYNILMHVSKTVPFYHNRIKADLMPKDVFSAISTLPIVTKVDINKNPEAFTSSKPGRGVYINSTGGSTGQPLRVLQDKTYHDWSGATKYLFNNWAGWKPGDKIMKIWGSQRDVLGQTSTIKSRISSKLRKIRVIDAFKISPQDTKKYVEEIEKYQPDILECYVDAAYTIAREMIMQKINFSHQVKGVIVSAGTLYPEFEKTIRQAFNAPVFNRYGSREAGDIACTCPQGQIHVNPFTHFVEIINDHGEPIEEGTGRILVTLLKNYTMPLIRYEIGDMATIKKNMIICECGRDWQTLERIDGRMGSIFYKRDGTAISPLFFVHFVGVVHNTGLFKKYQIIQEGYDLFRIKLVLANGVETHDNNLRQSLDLIRRDFLKVLGFETSLEFEFANEIDPLPSGKYQYAYSNISPKS